jgi:3-oxoacyl-[acyl-carrier protein] reductase
MNTDFLEGGIMELEEQVVMVTGGARGIGKAIAEKFAAKGAGIVIADVSLQSAEDTAKELSGKGIRAKAVSVDVSKSADVTKVFADVVADLGRIDVLVNNAGITRDSLLLRMKEEDWDLVLGINLKGVFLCSKEAVKVMVKQRYGRIVNIASVVAFMGNPGQANYSASKAGIIGLTKTTAREYANRGITANAVAPGFISTAMTDALSENIRQEMLKSIPLGRFGSVDDVASAVAFFAMPENGYITGQVMHVNGGMYM